MVAEMDRLLEDYNYADTARIFNEKGFTTGGRPAADVNSGRLCSKGLRTEEPLRSPSRTRNAYYFRDGASLRSFDKDDRPLAAKGLGPAHAVNDRAQFLFEHPGANLTEEAEPKSLEKRPERISGARIFRSMNPGDK